MEVEGLKVEQTDYSEEALLPTSDEFIESNENDSQPEDIPDDACNIFEYDAMQFEEDGDEVDSLPSDLSWDDDDDDDVEKGGDDIEAGGDDVEGGEGEEGNAHSCPICGKVLAASSSLDYHMKIHTGERPFPCEKCFRCFKVRAELNQHLKLDHGTVKPVPCDLCDMRFKRPNELKRHRRVHTGEKPYKCTYCDKAFAHRTPWRQHEETHSHEKKYKCEDCGVKFEYSTSYSEHVKEASCKNESFICCGEVFTKRMEYVTHKKQRHNETKKTVSCTYCSKVFAFPYALKQHELTHFGKKDAEPKVLPLNCVSCDENFNSRSTLYIHRTSKHPDEHPYQCKYCYRILATVGALKSHERHHVSDEYACNLCGEKYISRNEYFAHRRAHKTNQVHICQHCGKRLATAVALVGHERTHTGEKPNVCDICGKGFIQKQALTAHIRSHTKERPFTCSYCGQTFTYYSAMKCHERMHTGEKPYECQYCKRRFTRFGTYQNHVRLHTGEKPHACHICGKKFTQRSTQLSHMKTHDKKYVYVEKDGTTPAVTRRTRTVRNREPQDLVPPELTEMVVDNSMADDSEGALILAKDIEGQENQFMFTEDGGDGTITKVLLTGNLENFDPSSLANVVFSGNIDAETIAKLILGGNVDGTEASVVYTENVDENGTIFAQQDGEECEPTQIYYTEMNGQVAAHTGVALEEGESYGFIHQDQFA